MLILRVLFLMYVHIWENPPNCQFGYNLFSPPAPTRHLLCLSIACEKYEHFSKVCFNATYDCNNRVYNYFFNSFIIFFFPAATSYVMFYNSLPIYKFIYTCSLQEQGAGSEVA